MIKVDIPSITNNEMCSRASKRTFKIYLKVAPAVSKPKSNFEFIVSNPYVYTKQIRYQEKYVSNRKKTYLNFDGDN